MTSAPAVIASRVRPIVWSIDGRSRRFLDNRQPAEFQVIDVALFVALEPLLPEEARERDRGTRAGLQLFRSQPQDLAGVKCAQLEVTHEVRGVSGEKAVFHPFFIGSPKESKMCSNVVYPTN